MGLLDNLYFGQNANFGGQQGGLLDFLRTTQMQQDQYQPSQGFGTPPMDANAQMQQAAPIGVGDYQMPRIGSAQQFTPDPAAIPQNAQPTQGQMPMQAPQDQPAQAPEQSSAFGPGSFFGRIGNPDGLIARLSGNDTRSVALQQANQTAKYLVSKGMDPAMAKTVVSDPTLLRSVLPSIMGMGGQTDDIKEYQFAKKEDPTLTFDKFMSRKKSVTGEYGLTPIWGTGPDGQPTYIQPGKSGDARLANLPKGFQIARDPIKVDAGTHFVLLDPQTRQPVGQVPKDLKGAETQKAIGESQGKAQAALPSAIIDAENTVKKVDRLLENKEGLDSIVGAVDQYRPTWTLGDSGRNALARLEQLQGGAFLQAFSMLKGGGAVSEIEGAKAEKAVARMQRSQSEADFREALQDFRDAVNDGVRKLRASAGETGKFPEGVSKPATAPAAGTDLKAKYGLD